MTRGRIRSSAVVAVFGGDGPVDYLAVPVIGAFQPVRSRWTWQPRLPELWLREHEGRQFREMIVEQKKEN